MNFRALLIASIVSTGSIAADSPASALEDVTLSLSTGYDYSSGDYGDTEETTITFVPFTAQLELDAWTVKVSTSWLEIDGPGSLVADGDVVPGTSTGASGMGDTNFTLAYLIYPFIDNGPFVELSGKVKVPTADETKGLGSGETDVTGMASLFQKVGDSVTLFADAGYRSRGSSDLYDLENGFIGALGGSYKFSDVTTAGLMFNYRQAATETGEDPMDLTPYVTLKPWENWVVNTYATIGLSDASPESGFGIMLKRKIDFLD